MTEVREAFTVLLPEVRTHTVLGHLPSIVLFLLWILYTLVWIQDVTDPVLFAFLGVACVLMIVLFSYISRKRAELARIINARFGEEFTALTGFDYPSDVNILEVKQTVAVRTVEGPVFLWGVKKHNSGFRVVPTTLARLQKGKGFL